MPVGLGEHAVVRSLAGLAWVMAAMSAYVAWMTAMMLVTGGMVRFTSGLQWAGPVAAAVVLYFAGSAVALRSAHPWRWMGGAAVAYAFLASLAETARDAPASIDGAMAVLSGQYGFFTVASGLTPVPVPDSWTRGDGVVEHYIRIDHLALAGSWAVATWIWLAAAAALFVWAAYRQPER